ncbi:NAD(P)-binding protein [Coniochaeta ligniaria NRRL 30616]|uniref:NAD(P)-binding protein n=1 Tax=Coniochaeta ligniaria NRRL 30616 TaxID=1408157 RepID=A0A1J7IEN4_9PEZI|nr:NAD(P)-binding protein [Coniochaeta ligniaria NRRL 30616]
MASVPSSSDPILVLGGTSIVGKRVADQLASAAVPALVASLSGKAASSKWLTGVTFDWFDRATWENPWKAAGEHAVRAVYIIAPPIVDSAPIMEEFVNLALTKGTRRFVLQSATTSESNADWGMGQLHAYVRTLGNKGKADWAALRPTWFMENFSEREAHFKAIKDEKKIYSATNRGILPFVSADDVAACAVVLLTQTAPPHTEYMLLGPHNMSYEMVAQIIGEVIGKRVKHVSLSPQHLHERLQKMGLPKDYAKILTEYEFKISLQKEHRFNQIVEDLLGRKPIDFRTFAEKAKEAWI